MMRQYSTRSVPNIFHDKTHDFKYFFCLVQLPLSHDHELHDQTTTTKNEMNIVNICDQMDKIFDSVFETVTTIYKNRYWTKKMRE